MRNIFKIPELRRKLFFTLGILFVFRFLSHVPVPGIDTSAIKYYLQSNAFLGLFDLFSGGGFQHFSVVTLGLNPYINASIILQLFTMMIPSLEELSKEGESGREQINMYTRFLTVPLSFLQAYGMYFLLSQQKVINTLDVWGLIVLIFSMTAGTLLLMWLGELLTEYGIGNGISLLIFVGIIGRLPTSIVQFVSTMTAENFVNVLVFFAFGFAVIAAVVLTNEGTRNIQIQYGRTGARLPQASNYLPIKINQAGVIPIIFAVSMVMVPSMISAPLSASGNPTLLALGRFLASNFSTNSFLYNVTYFILVVGFAFFYTAVQFNPEKVADDIKKRGGFIPGIRPGIATKQYLGGVVNRLTLMGAVFLGVIAIMPFLIESTLHMQTVAIGGTGLLIVVSVVLETIRQIEAMMVTRNYQSFLD